MRITSRKNEVMRTLLTLFFLTSMFNYSFGQCNVSILNTMEDTLEVTCGTEVILERDVISVTPLFNSFNDTTIGEGWDGGLSAQLDNPCGPGPTNSVYLWMGPNTLNPRVLTTDPLNLSCGGQICFDFRMALQTQSSPCEGPDEEDEGVALQYQLPGSMTWDTIFYFEPDDTGDSNSLTPGSGDWTAWHYYCFQIPPAAQVPNVQLRWSQQAVSGLGFDHWGLDSISVELYCGSITQIWNTGDTGTTITTGTILSDTTYSVQRILETVINGTSMGFDTCYDSLTLVSSPPQVPVIPQFTPFCKDSDAEVRVNFNQAEFFDPSVTYSFQWAPDIFDSSTIDYGIVRGLNSDTSTVYLIEHPIYPECNFSDTIELLSGGIQIDSFHVTEPNCFRDDTGELDWFWSGQISSPVFRMFKDNANVLPPPLDTFLTDFEAGSYMLVLQDQRCADTIDFDVNLADTITLSLSGIDTNICVDSPTDQWFTADGGIAPYEYYFDSLLIDTFGLFSPFNVDTTFGLYAVDALGCVSDTTQETFIVPPSIRVQQFDTLVCPNIPFQITAVASGGLGGPYRYEWFNGDSTATTTVVGTLGGSYAITITDGCAERGVMNPQINIIPTPEHVILREYETVDPFTKDSVLLEVADNSVIIREVAPLPINFRPQPELAGSKYNWDLWFNGSEADRQYGWPVRPTESDSTIVTTGYYRYTKDDTYQVRLITTTEEGCIDTAFAAHILRFQGEAPNVITPNGDGINDFFYLPGSEALRDYELLIYDRWGRLVFETSNPNLPENGGGWDGGDQNDGTYFYVARGVRGNGTEHVDKGTFTLLSSDY